MSIDYIYEKEDSYIYSTVNDSVSIEQVSVYIDDIIDDKSIVDKFYEIADFSNVEKFDFGYYQTYQLVNLFQKLKKHKCYLGSCIVVKSDLSIGMSNMFSVVWEDQGLEINIFNSKEDAVKYIKQKIS